MRPQPAQSGAGPQEKATQQLRQHPPTHRASRGSEADPDLCATSVSPLRSRSWPEAPSSPGLQPLEGKFSAGGRGASRPPHRRHSGAGTAAPGTQSPDPGHAVLCCTIRLYQRHIQSPHSSTGHTSCCQTRRLPLFQSIMARTKDLPRAGLNPFACRRPVTCCTAARGTG